MGYKATIFTVTPGRVVGIQGEPRGAEISREGVNSRGRQLENPAPASPSRLTSDGSDRLRAVAPDGSAILAGLKEPGASIYR